MIVLMVEDALDNVIRRAVNGGSCVASFAVLSARLLPGMLE